MPFTPSDAIDIRNTCGRENELTINISTPNINAIDTTGMEPNALASTTFTDDSLPVMAFTSNIDTLLKLIDEKSHSYTSPYLVPLQHMGTDYFLIGLDGELESFSTFGVISFVIDTIVQVYFQKTESLISLSPRPSRKDNAKNLGTVSVRLGPFDILVGDTYQGTFRGTRILSSKPISVFQKLVDYRDMYTKTSNLQLLPVSRWGKRYIIIPIPNQIQTEKEVAEIITTQSKTTVSVGKDEDMIDEEGTVKMYPMKHTNEITLVIADNVIICFLVVVFNSKGQVALALPPLEQYTDTYILSDKKPVRFISTFLQSGNVALIDFERNDKDTFDEQQTDSATGAAIGTIVLSPPRKIEYICNINPFAGIVVNMLPDEGDVELEVMPAKLQAINEVSTHYRLLF